MELSSLSWSVAPIMINLRSGVGFAQIPDFRIKLTIEETKPNMLSLDNVRDALLYIGLQKGKEKNVGRLGIIFRSSKCCSKII